MAHDHSGRLIRARRACEDAGFTALIIAPSADLVYLVGYDAPSLERLTALVVRPNDDPVLVVPELEAPRARASAAGDLVAMDVWGDGQYPYDRVRSLIGTAGSPNGGAVGVSDRMFAAHLLRLQQAMRDAGFQPASAVMSRLRIRKDPEEVVSLERAARSADQTFALVTEEGLIGKREVEVAGALAEGLVRTGHDQGLFGIVGSGPNGASPHHDSGHRRIATGDVVVMDFGGRLGGYCSDMTRTVTAGEASAEAKEIHQVVRAAQEAALRAVTPGTPAQDVDRAARRVISEAGYGEAFIHRTGHGIGLDEHEEPYVVEGNEQPLETGMCFSLEPGIYLRGRFGVRIEDIVIVTDRGARPLNQASRDLLAVG